MPVFDLERVDRLKQLLKWHPRGITISDLATKMEMNRNLVAKYLDILLISGQVEMQVMGAAKVYFLTQRIPISSMLEFSSDMVIILDSTLTILQVNEPLLVQLNKKKEALAGRKINDIDHPFLNAIPLTEPSKGTDPIHDQVREFECTLDGKKHNYRIKQLQTAFEDGSQGITLIIEDITAQITYQKMLELNEAKYRGIVEDQTEFITRFLPDGTLIFINDAYARYLEKNKGELLGGPHIPEIDSDDTAVVNQCIQSLDTENPVNTFKCKIHHSSGQVRWNLWTVRALFDDNQKPIEYQGVGRDNTEKREAATRINQYARDMEFLSRKAQEFVELSSEADIFNTIGQGLSELLPRAVIVVDSYDQRSESLTVRTVFSDTDRQILSTCVGQECEGFRISLRTVPAPLKTFALSLLREGKLFHTDESIYNFFFQQVPVDICNCIKETLNLGDRYYGIGLVRQGILFGVVILLLRKGETLTNSSLIETFIRQGSVVLQRRLFEDSLKKSEARYRGIVEDQTEFITRFLPDGTLVFVNDAYARYLGKEKEELLGGPHIPEIDSDDTAVVNQCIQSLDIQNPVKTFECMIHHSSGQVRWNLWTVRALFDDNQKPIEYQGVGRDNTEKREAATRINQYIRDMEFLFRKAQEFVELSFDADIFLTVAQGLSEIIPDALITVNSIDMTADTLTVRAVLPNRDRELLTKCLGKDPLGFQFKISTLPEQQKIKFFSVLQEGKLVHIEENLHTLLFQQVPRDTCDMVAKSLDLGDSLYTIGLTRHGITFGSVSILSRKGEDITNSSIIEMFIRQASVVLHRRRADDALKASESRYRGIVEDQTEFVTRFLPDGTLTYVNDSVCRYFQKDLAELLGRSIFSLSLIPKEDQDRLLQNLQSLNAQIPIQSVEHRVLDPSGRIRWTQWTNRALFDDHGTIVEYQGVGRDITEQKEAETKIRQYIADIEYISRTSYEFLELPPDADIYGTICGEVKAILPKAIVVVNSIDLKTFTATTRSVLGDEERDVFSTLMGEDIIGKTVRFIKGAEGDMAVKSNLSGRIVRVPGNLFFTMHRNVPEAVCAKIEETLNIGDIYTMGLISQGIIVAGLVILLRKGDKLEHGELIETYVRQASVALQRGITEKSLKESEKLYRSVIENIQDVFYRSDTEGNLIMASPSFARLLGYDSLDDCIGYNIAEKFYFDPQRRKEFLDAVYRNGSVSDYEVTLKCRDGSPLYVSTNSHLYYDDAGSLLGVEGIFRDISERHAAAEKIQHHIKQMEFFSQKLQEFIELSPDTDIFEKIATDLKLLIADAMISVNSFNEGTGILTCRSCLGEEDRAVCTRYLGRDPREIDYSIDPEASQSLRTGQLHKVPFSLYDILFRVLPKETCDQIEEAIKLGDTYGIGFVRGGILFGNATIFLHKGAAIHDIHLIETYARAASIALQREIAEQSLKGSEEIFSNVARCAPFPIAIIEPDGTYRYINQKFVEIFGYDLNDFKTGREWFLLAYPDPVYRKNVIDAWKSDLDVSESGQQRPRTYTVRCKNGVDREIVFRPVTLSDNKQCVVYEDVTEQHMVDRVQNLLSTIVENSPDAIISKNIDGTITSWNPAAERFYGYKKDEILGRNITTIIPRERNGEIEEVFTRIKNGEFPVNLETLRVRKDGTIINIMLTVSPIIDKTGTIIGTSTIARNIPFNRSEEKLHGSGVQYRVPVENMHLEDPEGRRIGTVEITSDISHTEEQHAVHIPKAGNQDSANHETIKIPDIVNQVYLSSALKMAKDYIAILDRSGKCLWVNDALVSAVNAVNSNALAGKSIALYIAPEFRKLALDALMDVKKSGNKTVPFMMLSSSGRVPVEANISAINTEEGDLFGYMAIARHVDREKIEKPRG